MRSFLLAILLSVLASATFAMEPRIAFAPKRALEAGETVTLRWSGLPDEVDELEFLLQRDSGDVVRLTEQLAPASGSFAWIVPDLPSRRAVLVLRAGIEGREVTLASSGPFVIEGIAGRTRVQFRNGEWWMFGVPLPPSDSRLSSSVRTMRRAQLLSRTRRLLLVSDAVDCGGGQPIENFERTSSIANSRCGAPRTIPQRK